MDAGQVRGAGHPRQQPGLHRAGGSEVPASGSRRSPLVGLPRPLHDETAELCHWNIPEAHALETWGDRARLRRHGDAHAAADRAAVRRAPAHEVLAALHGAAGPQGARRSSRTTGRARSRAASGWTMQRRDRRSRSATPTRSGSRRSTTDSFAAPPRRMADRRRRSRRPNGAAAAGGSRAAAPRRTAAPHRSPIAPTPGRRRSRAVSRSIFRPDPNDLGRPLREQRLAAGAAEAADEADVGHGGVGQPAARRRAAASTTATSSSCAIAATTARLPVLDRARAARCSPSPCSSATAADGGPRRHVGRRWRRRSTSIRLRTSDAPWFGGGLEIVKTGDRYLLARTQEHHAMEGRAPGARRDARRVPRRTRRSSTHMGHTPPKTLTLYPRLRVQGPQVGHGDRPERRAPAAAPASSPASPRTTSRSSARSRSNRNREMHWIRVDHYFTGDIDRPESVQAVHQPVPCMQCENAPCEVGLPGRRDDAQLRRPERHGLQPLRRHALLLEQLPVQGAAVQLPALPGLGHAEPTSRCAIPDVTVRSRGVMEKCTYCVQRINSRAHRREEGGPRRSATARSSPPAQRPARPRRSCSAT